MKLVAPKKKAFQLRKRTIPGHPIQPDLFPVLHPCWSVSYH